MKKTASLLLSLVLALGAAFSLAGCEGPAPAGGADNTIRIGVSVYDAYDTFIGQLIQWFTLYAGEAEREKNITITIIQENADRNQTTQNKQVESFIEAGCDVICVNLVDRTDATGTIDRAKAADIPVLFFNRELVPEDLQRWDRLYYVGAPALDSGMLQGQLVADRCTQDFEAVDRSGDGVVQYVMLEGEAGHQDSIVRTEASVNRVIASGFALERLERGAADWNRAQAEGLMTRWLEQHAGQIEVVFANNDEMALGAVAALRKLEVPRTQWPMVVGIDGTPYGLAAVESGDMAGTVYNDAQGQAEALLELALSLAETGQPPADMELDEGKYRRLDYHSITTANVQEYLEVASQLEG